MKKAILAGLTTVLATGLLYGCGSSNENGAGSGSNANDAEKVELKWWVKQDEEAIGGWYDKVIAGFQKDNPNVTIKKEVVPSDNINEKISIAANTNQLPDIEQGSFFWPLSYASKDLLVPLDDAIDKDDFDSAVLDAVSVNGKTYISPNSVATIGLIVNKDMFKAKGALDLLPKNMSFWTTDQFMKAAKAVTDPAKGQYGYAMYAADTGGDQAHHAMLWGFGAKTFSDDNKTATLNSPEGVEGLQFLVSLFDAKVVPPGAAGLKATEVINKMFPAGQIGMTMGNVGHLGIFEQAFKEGNGTKFDMDLVPFPSKDGKSTNTALFGDGMWVWNTGNRTKMDWAKKFVAYANSKESVEDFAKLPSVISPRKSLAHLYAEDSFQGKSIKLLPYVGNIGLGVPGYPETRAAFFPALQAAFTKVKTPKQALDDWTAKANEIIARNAK
ncbi:sugar ABC transporter substrate-binding protein [Paenibacillus lycopersici]|uniref:Sugar ABC transporter substrate-binding protein n=1 Tax=Paenibacillus lycopersici TaxID=2704462 RepID=A0A6C0FW40_9BACL|nr:sugar ABC transporter substrate-binding protein [Paenibacillus lycopersici]QHT59663.1 sugar ABC transporter substrate-binding protein [Paenibacillus lycopersici]